MSTSVEEEEAATAAATTTTTPTALERKELEGSQKAKKKTTMLELPEGVIAKVTGREIVMKGPNGSATKVFQRIPVDVEIQGNQVVITPFTEKKKDVISANTFSSILRG